MDQSKSALMSAKFEFDLRVTFAMLDRTFPPRILPETENVCGDATKYCLQRRE